MSPISRLRKVLKIVEQNADNSGNSTWGQTIQTVSKACRLLSRTFALQNGRPLTSNEMGDPGIVLEMDLLFPFPIFHQQHNEKRIKAKNDFL